MNGNRYGFNERIHTTDTRVVLKTEKHNCRLVVVWYEHLIIWIIT